jgi:hypothetical protein
MFYLLIFIKFTTIFKASNADDGCDFRSLLKHKDFGKRRKSIDDNGQ